MVQAVRGAQRERIIALNGVGVSYARRAIPFLRSQQRFWALKDVTFDVAAGETVGIIGHNASGKSTLLKVIAGIIGPDHGHIERANINVSLLSLQVGFLPHLTGRENALLSAMLLGLGKHDARDRLGEIIEFADIGDFADEPLKTYSAGMRARLGFAVAYHSAAELILIDEILGVGDEDFRRKSAKAIEETIRSHRTVILVSHNMTTIQDLCNRVVWIEHGCSHSVGDPRTVISAYREHQIEASRKHA
jgi:homopolymeric O-antigen transport system ATP-binding protein